MKIRTILLAGGMLYGLLLTSQANAANGVNSMANTDLPIGAGGSAFMFLGGGGPLAQNTVNFGTSPATVKAWINSATGAASFTTVTIGGSVLNSTVVNSDISLANLTCPAGYEALTKFPNGTYGCIAVTDIVNVGKITVPSCAANQMLYFTGAGFTCIAAATGPQGPAGATGATGPQGPAGPMGATGPQGASILPSGTSFVVGGVDSVLEDDTGVFGYCRLQWGAISSCNSGGVVCSQGVAKIVTMSHDNINVVEDLSLNKFISSGPHGLQVNHFECIMTLP